MATYEEKVEEMAQLSESQVVSVQSPRIDPTLSATYANRFYVLANNHVVRFLIGDSPLGPDVDFKLSFVMTRTDAHDLAQAILNVLNTQSSDSPTSPQEP